MPMRACFLRRLVPASTGRCCPGTLNNRWFGFSQPGNYPLAARPQCAQAPEPRSAIVARLFPTSAALRADGGDSLEGERYVRSAAWGTPLPSPGADDDILLSVHFVCCR